MTGCEICFAVGLFLGIFLGSLAVIVGIIQWLKQT